MELKNRIAVIGCSGSGKSTVARQIGKLLSLPVIHLDGEYWQRGWTPLPEGLWQEKVIRLAQGEKWIIDGNYSGTMDVRLEAAETIIFLDLPRWLCLLRIFRRWLTFRGRTRPDMPEGCVEQLDLEFVRWVWNYPTRSRPKTIRKLEALQGTKQIFWLKSAGEVDRFLKAVAGD